MKVYTSIHRPEVTAIAASKKKAQGPVTIQDVARAAKVHAASVSRALRGRPGEVSEKTRQKILAIAQRLGYQPNVIAASLRTRQTNLVAIIVTDISNPVLGPIIQGLESELRRSSMMCMVVQTTPSAADRRELVVQLASRRVSGLLVLSAEIDDPMLDEISLRGLPAVLVNRGFGETRFPYVVNDEREGVRQVLEHLAGLGHKRIAHIHGPLTATTGSGRYQAFLELAPQFGFSRPLLAEAATFTREAGAQAARNLLRRSSRCTAIFASNDLLAMGVLGVLKASGLKVPVDVSLVGFNDMPFVDLLEPPLTTVHVSAAEMSRAAAHLLLQMVDGGQGPRQSLVLPPRLVVRASTAAPSGPVTPT
jgi:LacI family transcriptional regulator